MSELATLDNEKIQLIKDTICKGSTDQELQLFVMQCNRTGLDPFSRQIHAVKRWNGKTKREEMSIQVGIDGLRLIADRTGTYAGNDNPVFEVDENGYPTVATCTVYKIVAGQKCAFTRSARWDEVVQLTKEGQPNSFWRKMPFLMLGKVAESMALRAAFPADLSGLYTPEEMQGEVIDVQPVEQEAEPQPALPQPPVQLPIDDAKLNECLAALQACKSLDELKDDYNRFWKLNLTDVQRMELQDCKDECKQQLLENAKRDDRPLFDQINDPTNLDAMRN